MRILRLVLLSMLFGLVSGVAMAETCQQGSRPTTADTAPLAQIRNLTGYEFDIAYMKAMYQLNSDIQALALQEYQSTNDRILMDMSQHIAKEQADKNAKLAMWFKQLTGGELSSFCVQSSRDYSRLQTVGRMQFDNEYVEVTIAQLQRARDAAQLAISRTTMPQLRHQAQIVVRAADKEIKAFQNWQNNLPVRG